MEKYRVEGRAVDIGSGEVIGLTKAQFDARKHNLDENFKPEIEDVQHYGGLVICRVMTMQQFKIGETIYLPYAPPRSMADRLVLDSEPVKAAAPVVPEKPAKPRPPKKSGGAASKPTGALTLQPGKVDAKASRPSPAMTIGAKARAKALAETK